MILNLLIKLHLTLLLSLDLLLFNVSVKYVSNSMDSLLTQTEEKERTCETESSFELYFKHPNIHFLPNVLHHIWHNDHTELKYFK